MKVFWLVATLMMMMPLSAAPSSPSARDELIGSWKCASGACPDEVVQLAVENGVRVYRSWLHDHPSCSEGAWSKTKGQLCISCRGKAVFRATIVQVTKSKLVLRVGKTRAVLTRMVT